MKKILLTGARGFIGRNVLELLAHKYDFFHPSHAELDLLDSTKVKACLSAGHFDIVIHTAGVGVSSGQGKGVFEQNKNMFLSLAENNQLYGRLIFLGSGAEYGKQSSIAHAKEADFGKVLPEDEYGRAKYFASEKIASLDNVINLRCFGVYGKYENFRQRFISNNICSALLGRPLSVNQDAVFDYIYVNDLVKIIEHFIIHEPKQRFYNAASGRPQHLLEIAEVIKEICGASEIIVKKSGLNKEYSCDVSLLKQEMGEIPHTDLHQAISAMRDYYRERLSEIKQALS